MNSLQPWYCQHSFLNCDFEKSKQISLFIFDHFVNYDVYYNVNYDVYYNVNYDVYYNVNYNIM